MSELTARATLKVIYVEPGKTPPHPPTQTPSPSPTPTQPTQPTTRPTKPTISKRHIKEYLLPSAVIAIGIIGLLTLLKHEH